MGTDSEGYTVNHFSPGERIFAEGERGRQAYLVKSGRVTLTRASETGDVPLATLPTGAVFGEMAVLTEGPRSATACALDACELVVVEREHLNQALSGSHPLLRKVIQQLFERLKETNARVQEAPRRDPYHPLCRLLDLKRREAALERGIAVEAQPCIPYQDFLTEAQAVLDLRTTEATTILDHLGEHGLVEIYFGDGSDGNREMRIHFHESTDFLGRTQAVAPR